MADQRLATESRYSAFTRDSILSDPRLSQVKLKLLLCMSNNNVFQLFDISQQLEALAESLPCPQAHTPEVKYYQILSFTPFPIYFTIIYLLQTKNTIFSNVFSMTDYHHKLSLISFQLCFCRY